MDGVLELRVRLAQMARARLATRLNTASQGKAPSAGRPKLSPKSSARIPLLPCVHTRNDQLASQNTVHPSDDRVFSIRELMRMMTIPDNFRWVDKSLEELNALPEKEKKSLLKKEAVKIRQSLGEAVPTQIFNTPDYHR